MSSSLPMNLSSRVLIGCDDGALIYHKHFNCTIHPLAAEALEYLAEAATFAGFSLRVASGYRSFERQLSIWNDKAYGRRPVLDCAGQPIAIDSLTNDEKLFAILRWSALPGASRHHWGTDVDVFDISRIAPDYQLQLTVEETQGDGPFAEFHQWLTEELNKKSQAFFRPYVAGVGSIAPEPWHLSFALLAHDYARQLTEDILYEAIQRADIALKDNILNHLSTIFLRYVRPYQS